jgi:ankyrin repeat protein
MDPHSLRATDSHGRTSLHRAVEQGDKDQLLSLLEAGADVEACTAAGNNPLHLAARRGYTALFPWLITPATFNQQNGHGFTPLQVALLHTQWKAATVLVAAGASTYNPGSFHSCLRLRLAHAPDDTPHYPLKVLHAMLANRGPTGLLPQALRWKDAKGWTALHMAAGDGCIQRVTNLLAAGADRHATNHAGATPLWLAAAGGHAHLVPLLATPGNINTATYSDRATPLHVAAAGGHVQTLEALVAAGAETDIKDSSNRTPLAVAVLNSQMTVVRVLLEALVTSHGQLKQQMVAAMPALPLAGQPRGYEPRAQMGDGTIGPNPFKRLLLQLVQQQQQAAPTAQQQQLRQQWQQQQRQQQQQTINITLAGLIVGAVTPSAKQLKDTPGCARLLGVVLDVMGPGVVKEVCTQVQQQLQEEWKQQTYCPIRFDMVGQANNRLAEALLLGWMGAEARRVVPARLQRLVPGLGDSQQQLQGEVGTELQQQQKQEEGSFSSGRIQLPGLLQQAREQLQAPGKQQAVVQQLLKAALVALAGGRTHLASHLVGLCAEVYVQQAGWDWASMAAGVEHTPLPTPPKAGAAGGRPLACAPRAPACGPSTPAIRTRGRAAGGRPLACAPLPPACGPVTPASATYAPIIPPSTPAGGW